MQLSKRDSKQTVHSWIRHVYSWSAIWTGGHICCHKDGWRVQRGALCVQLTVMELYGELHLHKSVFWVFLCCCCCCFKSLNAVYTWQLFVKYGYVCAGKSPSQQFTTVIHMVTPLQSQISPVVKLIIAVAKSKFCAQVGYVSELCCDFCCGSGKRWKNGFTRMQWNANSVRRC